jgi:pyruvate/2-oxoglutarate dehydrogenase complex dihydrolipoamide dehydrogenase (E3) component
MTSLAFEIATIAHYLSMAPGSRPDTGYPPPRSRVTIFANGSANPDNDADIARGLDTMKGYGIAVDERPVLKLVRDPEQGVNVHLLDSEPVFMGFLFYKPVTEPADITQKVISQFGIETVTSEIGTGIAVDSSTASTNTPGLFVVGDAGSTSGNESNAIHSGVMAAAGVPYFVNQLDSKSARKLWLNTQNGSGQNGETQYI